MQLLFDHRGPTHGLQNSAWAVLKKYWPDNLTNNIKGMRNMSNSSGVCFDMYEDQSGRFMDFFDHLKEKGTDIEAKQCTELPDLEDDGTGGWRPQGNDNYGGGSSSGGWRGGTSGGYQGDSGYRGGGGRGGYSRGGGGYDNG